jgi:hypothetical protein
MVCQEEHHLSPLTWNVTRQGDKSQDFFCSFSGHPWASPSVPCPAKNKVKKKTLLGKRSLFRRLQRFQPPPVVSGNVRGSNREISSERTTPRSLA